MVEPQMAQAGTSRPFGGTEVGLREGRETRGVPARAGGAEGNARFPWDEFDTASYLRHNYRDLRSDDRQILEVVRDFLVDFLPGGQAEGLDLGSGPNLYPALAMLPLCSKITLVERSLSNVTWLRDEVKHYGPSWNPFWELLCEQPRYRALADPRAALADRVSVEPGSVFDLPRRRWQVGTMFFVAESISDRRDEFEAAIRRFAQALCAGAPFAAAFMENSLGYDVGGHRFPAVAVDADYICSILQPEADDLRISRIGIGSEVLRPGYTGMITVCGRVRAV
jgi:hypothetical protein